MKKLTQKQENFVRVYLQTGNASKAYRESYTASNMTAQAVKTEASRLLDHPIVSLTIEQANKQANEVVEKKLEITKEWVLEQLVFTCRLALGINIASDHCQNGGRTWLI